MDNNLTFKEIMEMFSSLLSWIQNSSAAMDFQTLVICGAVFILSALAVYIISVYGMRERTYEEAIEEQRKRNKEAVQQAKHEKTRKDKKFKKWSKKKERDDEKGLPSDGIDEHGAEAAAAHLSMDVRVSSFDFDSKSHKKKRKMRRSSGKEIPQPSSSDDTDEQISHSSSCNEPRSDLSVGLRNEMEGSVDRGEEFPSEQQEINSHGADLMIKLEHELEAAAVQTKSPGKKKRKHRERSSHSESTDLNTGRVLSFLRSGVFSEEEIYLFLDVLNSKQSGIEEWTKKNDPVPGLKKQLQDREEIIESEHRLLVAANEKLKALKQEFNQERARYQSVERSLREKVNHQHQEIQNLRATLQHTHDQHMAELQAKMQQVKTKMAEEHAVSIKQLQEENTHLQTINRIEKEQQQLSVMEVTRLKHELEISHTATENAKTQYETRRAAMKKTQDELHHKINTLQKRLDEVLGARKTDEYRHQAEIQSINKELMEAEKSNRQYINNLQNNKSLCNSLEVENKTMRKRMEECTLKINSFEQERLELKSRQEDLVSCMDQMQNELMELRKERNDCITQIQELTKEKEAIAAQITDKLVQPSADASRNVSSTKDKEETRMITAEELEQKMKEKDYLIQHLLTQLENSTQSENVVDMIEKYRWNVHLLTKEMDDLKNANDELKLNYENATEALKMATNRVETLEVHLQETERRFEGGPSSSSHETLLEKVKCARLEIEELRAATVQVIKAHEYDTNSKIASLKEMLQCCSSQIKAELEIKYLQTKQDYKVVYEKLTILGKKTKEFLETLYPEIRISDDLDEDLWVLKFTEEAKQLKEQKTSLHSEAEVEQLKTQLDNALLDKSQLKAEVEKYVAVLSDTEKVLLNLQNHVEKEEKKWKDELFHKEKNLGEVLHENKKLSLEKQALEAHIEQLEGLKEMESELRALQAKLVMEEEEKLSLHALYVESLARIDELQNSSKLHFEEKEKVGKGDYEASVVSAQFVSEDIPAPLLADTASVVSALSGENSAPLSAETTSNASLKCEKRKKPRKRKRLQKLHPYIFRWSLI